MSSPIYTFVVLLYLSLLAVAIPGGAPATTPTVCATTTVRTTTTVHATTTSRATTTITVTEPSPTTPGQCNVGPIQCCQQVTPATSASGNLLLGLLGIVVEGLDVLLGLDCSPISVVGVGTGDTCDASPVGCEDNAVGNLISIGCIVITL